MFKRWLVTTATLSIAGLLVSLMPDAHAAGLVRKGEVKQQDTFNPKTDAADLHILKADAGGGGAAARRTPLPCPQAAAAGRSTG